MILEQQKQSQVFTDGQESQESIGMSLDLDSAQVLMQMLSKNLYSDSIGSTIRECASNALDSHRRAGVNEPIVVSLKISNANTYEFSVEDFGIGLDAEDVKNIISKYGKSTKRNSDTELGMMGLGFKAPLAYTSSFYFVCRKNGIERKYMMYEGEDVNTIDLLYETPTEERNGVRIIVPVGRWDFGSFKTKIREQLAYFENVYFQCDDIDNTFSIVRHEHFQWSPLCSDKNLHICLDNVYYPIDFQKLGISTINFPVALRFGLSDGLFPTPNRESIRYTQEAKAIILKRISQVADFFVEKYNETIQDSDDPIAVLSYYKKYEKTVNLFNSSFNIGELTAYNTIPLAQPKILRFPHLNMKLLADNEYYLFGEYEVATEIHRGRCSNNRGNLSIRSFKADDPSSWGGRIPVMLEGTLTQKLKDYLKEKGTSLFNIDNRLGIRIIKRNKHSMKLGYRKNNYTSYYSILELRNHPKSQWRTIIQEFQQMLDMIDSKIPKISAAMIPQTWIDARKKVYLSTKKTPSRKGLQKLEGEVIGKMAVALERFTYEKNCKFIPVTIQMKDAHREKKFTIYSHHNDAAKLDKLYQVLNINSVRILSFSEREMKTLSKIKLHNWMSMEEFMKGEHIVFKRAVTSYLIKTLQTQNSYVFNRIEFVGKISSDLSDKLRILYDYSNKYSFNTSDSRFWEDAVKIAENSNLFDHSVYGVYNEIKSVFETYSFMNTLCQHIPYHSPSKFIDIFVDLFKYNRKRVNIEHYKMVKLNIENPTPVDVETLEEAI